eukprot:2191077-Alexandrium_andersonii.AAC.1
MCIRDSRATAAAVRRAQEVGHRARADRGSLVADCRRAGRVHGRRRSRDARYACPLWVRRGLPPVV